MAHVWIPILLLFLQPFPLDKVMKTVPISIQRLVEQGELSQAIQQLRDAARASSSKEDRALLLWEAERLRRIRLDYTLTPDTLLAQLKERIPTMNPDDVERWNAEGRLDSRILDGAQRFLYASAKNLIIRYPDIRAQCAPPPKEPLGHFLRDLTGAYAHPEQATKDFTSPRRFHVQMSLTVHRDAVPDGEIIRCWLPFPQELPSQQEIQLLHADPAPLHSSPSEAPHRSLYFEQKVRSGSPTVFTIEYSYLSRPRLNLLEAETVTNDLPETVRPYLREEPPHIQFLPELETETARLVGEEKNPLRKAQRIYQWMCRRFRYSFAREYYTLRNISQYAYQKQYGDCGQLALLFITMCRMEGIPARWESGWMLYPGAVNLHDWCGIYLAPYGWVPVDVNMGVEATHTWDFLEEPAAERIRRFYLGSLDAYRLIVNTEEGRELDPPKRFVRSDTVDFQRGEVETREDNLYYDRFDYALNVLSQEAAP